MTRIIAGQARGRRLAVPPKGTRPTSDRVREALFSSLGHEFASGWAGVRVLDLYAGSGALGLEAASRGASHVLLVERAPAAVEVIGRNMSAVGVPGVEVLASDVARAASGPAPGGGGFDLVLLDPPYELPSADVVEVLATLLAQGWIAAGAVVVVERSASSGALLWPVGIDALRDRRYGDTALWLGQAARA